MSQNTCARNRVRYLFLFNLSQVITPFYTVCGTLLSGILAKSGPLDFATKNSFPLFFVCEKGLVHMYQNYFIYFPILYFCFATSQNPILPATGFPVVIKRLKFMDFETRVTAN